MLQIDVLPHPGIPENTVKNPCAAQVIIFKTLIRETHYLNLWCIPDKYWV